MLFISWQEEYPYIYYDKTRGMTRIVFLLLFCSIGLSTLAAGKHPSPSQQKNLTITINDDGSCFIGRDTVYLDKLAFEVQQRLWKSWLGTGKTYDSIIILLSGDVLMGTKSAALDAIKAGREKALNGICVEKFKREYVNLSASQQKKMKNQFPVLFQELHW